MNAPELVALMLADGRLPTGGHTQSAGLEPAVRAGLGADGNHLEDVPAYARDRLHTITRVEAATAVVTRHIVLHAQSAQSTSTVQSDRPNPSTPPDQATSAEQSPPPDRSTQPDQMTSAEQSAPPGQPTPPDRVGAPSRVDWSATGSPSRELWLGSDDQSSRLDDATPDQAAAERPGVHPSTPSRVDWSCPGSPSRELWLGSDDQSSRLDDATPDQAAGERPDVHPGSPSRGLWLENGPDQEQNPRLDEATASGRAGVGWVGGRRVGDGAEAERAGAWRLGDDVDAEREVGVVWGLGVVEGAWGARTPSQVLRGVARRQGRLLLRLAQRVWPEVLRYLPEDGEVPRAIVLGVVAAVNGLSAEQVARITAYDDVQTVVSASLKLLPVDPADAAIWLNGLHDDIERLVKDVAPLTDPDTIPADGAPLIDVFAHQHATERMRLFHA